MTVTNFRGEKMSKKPYKNEKEELALPARFERAPRPAVMLFQPSNFEIIPSERIREWEHLLATSVGLKGNGLGQLMQSHGVPTVCGCPTKDDCDEF